MVVGAGLAGLVAAYGLDRAGFAVTVLEARPRVGGRVYTLRAPFEELQHAEGGGEFIDTSHVQLLGYARMLGLTLEDAQAGPDLDAVVYLDGRRRLEQDVYTDAVTAQVDRLDARSDALSRSIDPRDPLRRGAAFDSHSLADLMDEVGLSGIARTLAEHSNRDEYGVEPAKLSLLFHLQLTAITRDLADADIERYRIRGGNDQVPTALAQKLGDRVRLAAPAIRVDRRADGVSVTTERGDVERADWCVLATPLPALRGVGFAPALPAELSGAIASFQYGAVTKTTVQYRERLWRKRGYTGDTVTDLPIGTTWEATVAQLGAPGVLIAYSSDGSAPPVGAAAEQIDRVYPGSAPLALGGTTVDWPHERFTGGSYSAPAPGQMTRCLRALRRPVGRIVLAGEHTDTVASYMEGAVRSGQRAAAMIERLA